MFGFKISRLVFLALEMFTVVCLEIITLPVRTHSSFVVFQISYKATSSLIIT